MQPKESGTVEPLFSGHPWGAIVTGHLIGVGHLIKVLPEISITRGIKVTLCEDNTAVTTVEHKVLATRSNIPECWNVKLGLNTVCIRTATSSWKFQSSCPQKNNKIVSHKTATCSFNSIMVQSFFPLAWSFLHGRSLNFKISYHNNTCAY